MRTCPTVGPKGKDKRVVWEVELLVLGIDRCRGWGRGWQANRGRSWRCKFSLNISKWVGAIPSVHVLELWADSIFPGYSSSSTIEITSITISSDFRGVLAKSQYLPFSTNFQVHAERIHTNPVLMNTPYLFAQLHTSCVTACTVADIVVGYPGSLSQPSVSLVASTQMMEKLTAQFIVFPAAVVHPRQLDKTKSSRGFLFLINMRNNFSIVFSPLLPASIEYLELGNYLGFVRLPETLALIVLKCWASSSDSRLFMLWEK